MKPAQVPLLKEPKLNKLLQWKRGDNIPLSKFKNQTTKRQRIVMSANAGHVRGGHSFH